VFFSKLGKSGREEQNGMFAMCISQLEEAQSHARNDYMDGSKLYTALGALVGVGICVMMV